MIHRLLALCCALLLAGCTNFMELRQELQESKTQLGRVAGTVVSPSCADCPTILVALDDLEGRVVHTYRVYERPGASQMVTFGGSRYLFGFNDLNNDFQYEQGEPSGWVRLPEKFAAGTRVEHIELSLSRTPGNVPAFGNLFDLRGMTLGTIDVELGKLADLADARFDPDIANLGMWQPLRFMKDSYAGIYFLGPYDAGKSPVLFVHGINGSPRDFAAMIATLDRSRFQPWVLYYPTGIDLASLGDGVLGMLSELRHRYPFKRLHIVAHSMGGVVVRSYLSACARAGNCNYLRSFTSISSPFGGHQAAQSGVDYAPVVMPVWRSMAPGSSFMTTLFATPLPRQVHHHLIFGYRNNVLVGKTSGDGTITLVSQLRKEAQAQAVTQRGFDEDHLTILKSDEVSAYVNGLLSIE